MEGHQTRIIPKHPHALNSLKDTPPYCFWYSYILNLRFRTLPEDLDHMLLQKPWTLVWLWSLKIPFFPSSPFTPGFTFQFIKLIYYFQSSDNWFLSSLMFPRVPKNTILQGQILKPMFNWLALVLLFQFEYVQFSSPLWV